MTALIAFAIAAATCGPATYTNTAPEPMPVVTQLGEGYVEQTLAPGETLTYWEAAPGRGWAVWNAETGEVLASGVQCGEPVNVEDPVVDADVPAVDPVQDDTEMVVTFTAEEVAPVPAPTPLPWGVAVA